MKNFLNQIKYANPNLPKSTKIIYGSLFVLLMIGVLSKVITNPWILLQIAVLIFSVSCHELAHGYTANRFGDPTARLAGRLTLNPIKHIDLLGILVPIVLIFSGAPFVIGWAKPVPISYRILKKNRFGYFSVSIAGIFVNLFLVFFAATMLKFFPLEIKAYIYLLNFLLRINLVLAVFNLLPIPPLDGSKILESFLDEKGVRFLESMERYGFILIIVLLATGVLQPIISSLMGMILQLVNIYLNL